MNSTPVDDGRMAAWATLLQAQATLTGIMERELMAESGIHLTWYEVLTRLERNPSGALRMQDLANSLLLSKSGATRLIDRMEQAGLVKRRACAADRRGTYAAITQVGRHALRRATPVHLRGVQEHFGRLLSDGEVRSLREILAKVVGANEGHPCEPLREHALTPNRRPVPEAAEAR